MSTQLFVPAGAAGHRSLSLTRPESADPGSGTAAMNSRSAGQGRTMQTAISFESQSNKVAATMEWPAINTASLQNYSKCLSLSLPLVPLLLSLSLFPLFLYFSLSLSLILLGFFFLFFLFLTLDLLLSSYSSIPLSLSLSFTLSQSLSLFPLCLY